MPLCGEMRARGSLRPCGRFAEYDRCDDAAARRFCSRDRGARAGDHSAAAARRPVGAQRQGVPQRRARGPVRPPSRRRLGRGDRPRSGRRWSTTSCRRSTTPRAPATPSATPCSTSAWRSSPRAATAAPSSTRAPTSTCSSSIRSGPTRSSRRSPRRSSTRCGTPASRVGHALRNVRDCVKLGGKDLKVKTALLDTRFLAGDAALYERVRRARWSATSSSATRAASSATRSRRASERHRRYGDSVYLVEPQLKEGEGGLRDLHTAMWLAKVKYVVQRPARAGGEGRAHRARVRGDRRGARFPLARAQRAALPVSGQHQDQLTFEFQERIAADLGYRDDGRSSSGVEQFMRTYYLHARTVNRFSDDIIARCLERPAPYRLLGRARRARHPPGRAHRRRRAGRRRSGGLPRRSDRCCCASSPTRSATACRSAPRRRRLIRASARADRRRGARAIPAAARAFLDVLGWPHGVYETLHEMHELDVLDAFLPGVRAPALHGAVRPLPHLHRRRALAARRARPRAAAARRVQARRRRC